MSILNRRRGIKAYIALVLIIAMLTTGCFSPIVGGVRTAYALEDKTQEEVQTPADEETPIEQEAPDEETPIEQEAPDEETPIQQEVSAEETEAKEPEPSQYLLQAKEENKPIKIKEECDEYTNVFQNPDGTITVDIYVSPVNFTDGNGVLTEIQNDIVPVDITEKEEGFSYRNNSGPVEILLPKDIVSATPIQVNYEQYSFEMTPIIKGSEMDTDTLERDLIKYEAKEVKQAYKDGEVKKFSTEEEKVEAIKIGGAEEKTVSLKYASECGNEIEIEYTTINMGIKEDIILHEYSGRNSFDFLIAVGDLVPKITEAMDIVFIDQTIDKVVATIPSPYMYDSYEGEILEEDGDHVSEAVTYTLKKTEKKGEYILTVTADKEFLQDKDTVYPVYIDPTFVFNTTSEVYDTFLSEKKSNNIYGGDTRIKCGTSGTFGKLHGLVYFNGLHSKIYGGTVYSASLKVYEDYGYTSSADFDIHRIQSSWSESTAKWSNHPSYDANNIYATQNIHGKGSYTWNVTSLVQYWAAHSASHYDGLLIKYRNETSSTTRYRRFLSSEYGGTNAIKLTIDYIPKPSAPIVKTITPNAYNSGTGSVKFQQGYVAGASTYKFYLENGTYIGQSAATYPTFTIPSGYHTVQRKVVYTDGRISPLSSPSTQFLVPDRSAPNKPSISNSVVVNGGLNSGDAIINIPFNAVSDNPSGGTVYYDLYNGSTLLKSNINPGTYAFNAEDNTTYSHLKVRARDTEGNWNDSATVSRATGDRTSPSLSNATFTLKNQEGQDITGTLSNEYFVLVSWSGITDECISTTNTITVEWMRYLTGQWETLGTGLSGEGEIDCRVHGDGITPVYLRVKDSAGNTTNQIEISYIQDTIAPEASIIIPKDGHLIDVDVNGESAITASVSDANNVSWTIDYGYGSSATSFYQPAIASGTGEIESSITWDVVAAQLDDNRPYTLRLTAEDGAGNTSEERVTIVYAEDANNVERQLVMTVQDGSQPNIQTGNPILDENVIALYEHIDGVTPLEGTAKLYVNDDEKTSAPVSEEGLAFDPLEWADNNWVYPEGSQAYMRVMNEETDGDLLFSNTMFEGHKIEASTAFENTTGMNLVDTVLANGKIELDTAKTSGSIASDSCEINGTVYHVYFTVDEEIIQGVNGINYYLVYGVGEDGVANTADDKKRQIYPNQTNYDKLNLPINDFYIQAELWTNDVLKSPKIDSWHLDMLYLYFNDSVVVNNTFEKYARGFKLNGDVTHDIEDDYDNRYECIRLMDRPHELPGDPPYYEEGSVESTVRTVPGEVYEVFLSVTENAPLNTTSITYKISTDGGQSWSQSITPGTDETDNAHWVSIESEGNEIIIKAELESLDGGFTTPVLDFWELKCRQTLAGDPHDIKLIDEPEKLSTLVNANYTTLLRWEASETTGVTYNLYRSTTPYFSTSESTPYKTGITENYWSDYNLEYGKTFYYKVTAVKSMQDQNDVYHNRESLPSNEAWATMVSQGEMSKKLGLQNYWTYSGFNAGAGTGYVNVANGNVVFKTTDMVIPGPFYGMVMNRTLNTIADSKTPLGYMWDYSFNTTLLREIELNETSGEYDTKALILKDGDGSFHRFEYDAVNNKFKTAKGTFMELSEVKVGDEVVKYEIKRKDGITYIFDAFTMQLDKFVDEKGKELNFTYNLEGRGNLNEVTNSVNEKVTLQYKTECELPDESDFDYVNWHIDMLETVTWTRDGASIVYEYTYDNLDRLLSVKAIIGTTEQVVERFEYNVDLNGDEPGYNTSNILITDAEGRITVIELGFNGEMTKIYDPIVLPDGLEEPIDYTDYLNDYYTYTYADTDSDSFDDKTTLTNSYGVSIDYEYNKDGLIKKKTDASGYSIAYDHNDDYLVTKVMYDNDNPYDENSDAKNYMNVYTYDDVTGNIENIKSYVRDASSEHIGDKAYYTALAPETSFEYEEANFPYKVTKTTVTKDDTTSVVTVNDYHNTYGYLLTTTVASGSTSYNDGTTQTQNIEKTTEYTYYSVGHTNELQLKSIEDNFGKITLYVYDNLGRVVDVEEYLDSISDTTYQRTLAHYSYDVYGQTDWVTEVYDKDATDQNGDLIVPKVVDLVYDEFGRLQYTLNPDDTYEQLFYDSTGRLDTKKIGLMDNVTRNADDSVDINASGLAWDVENTFGYEYDVLGRMRFTTTYNGLGEADNVVNEVKYEKWDSDITIPGDDADKIIYVDPMGRESIEYYDITGRLEKTVVKNGTETLETQYFYDDIGNMVEIIDPTGTVSKAYYNDLNQQNRTVMDPFVDGETGHMSMETLLVYDYAGNVREQTQRSYDDPMNCSASTTTYTDYTTYYTYDDLGRIETVRQADPNSSNPSNPDYLQTTYYYDRVVTLDGETRIKNWTKDPLGRINETYFDQLGQTVKSWNKADTSDDADHDVQNGEFKYMETLYEYDVQGKPFTITKTDGTFEMYSYNDLDQLETVGYYANGADTDTDSPLQSIGYAYTSLGQVRTETMTDGTISHDTSYDYNTMGQVVSVWEGTWMDGAKQKIGDEPGESDGLDVSYTYYLDGQLDTIHYNTSGSIFHTLDYLYDGYGRISEVRLDSQTGDDNTVRKYVYDGAELDWVEDYRTFDTIDNSASFAPYIKTDYTYNNLGMITEIEYRDFTAQATSEMNERYTYTYDGRGLITTEKLETDYNTAQTVFKGYEYDSLGRLVRSGDGDDAPTDFNNWDNLTAYTYDELGSRKSMDNGTNVLSYDYTQFNQLDKTYVTVDDADYTQMLYKYDARGNQTHRYSDYDSNGDAGKADVYTFDLLNRMTKVETTTDTATLTNLEMINKNIFNARGQRIKKNEPYEDHQGVMQDDWTKYFYSGSAVLYATDGINTLETENILSPGGSTIASWRNREATNEECFFFNYDVRGSVTNVVNPDGTLKEGYTYDEFGNMDYTEYDSQGNAITNPSSETFDNEVTFTSSITDMSTGLQYMSSRFYEPSTGRFISQDSYSGNVYEPWTQHLYSYTGNNPTNFVDPTGHRRVENGNGKDAKDDWRNRGREAVVPPEIEPGFWEDDSFFDDDWFYNDAKILEATVQLLIYADENGGFSLPDHPQDSNQMKVIQVLLRTMDLDISGNWDPATITVLQDRRLALGLSDEDYYTLNSSDIWTLYQGADQHRTEFERFMNGPGIHFVNAAIIIASYKVATSACFVAGTLIATEEGLRPIEEIRTGDMVWAEDTITGEKTLKEVVQTFVRETYELIEVHVSDIIIKTTYEHPFWVEGKGWVNAGELSIGDVLRLRDADSATVTLVNCIPQDEPVIVYNFEVKDFHTYYVTDNKVLVHNTCSSKPSSLKVNNKQVGKKFGEHMSDKPGYRNHIEYSNRANEVFNNPDLVLWDRGSQQYFYYQGNDMLRVLPDGTFMSLYPWG